MSSLTISVHMMVMWCVARDMALVSLNVEKTRCHTAENGPWAKGMERFVTNYVVRSVFKELNFIGVFWNKV